MRAGMSHWIATTRIPQAGEQPSRRMASSSRSTVATIRMTKSFEEHEAGQYELLFWLDAPGPGGRMYLAGISGITVG